MGVDNVNSQNTSYHKTKLYICIILHKMEIIIHRLCCKAVTPGHTIKHDVDTNNVSVLGPEGICGVYVVLGVLWP